MTISGGSMKAYRVLLWICLCILTISCQPHKGTAIMSEQSTIILGMGEQGVKDFAKYTKEQEDYSVAKMGFLTLRWRSPKLGTVMFHHGKAQFEMKHVFLAIGTQYKDRGYTGVNIIDVDGGLNAAEFVSAQDAYIAYVKLMEQLNKNGWKQYFKTSAPRIAKQDNLKYLLEERQVIDPSHIFSYEEWQKIMTRQNNYIWYQLYQGDVILGITITYSNLKEKKQQFMVRYEFETARYDARSYIENEDKMTALEFQSAVDEVVNGLKSNRQVAELELKSKGYHIDEDYVGLDIWEYAK